MKKIKYFVAAVLLIIFDQIVKYLTVTKLSVKPFIILDGVFELTYVENSGTIFGMFQGGAVVFAIMTILLLAVVIYTLIKLPETRRMLFMRILCVLIIAGGIGNLIDRVLHGYVIDTFYFKLINFPVFNVADCYVTISVFLFIILFLFYYKEEDFENIFASKKGRKVGE